MQRFEAPLTAKVGRTLEQNIFIHQTEENKLLVWTGDHPAQIGQYSRPCDLDRNRRFKKKQNIALGIALTKGVKCADHCACESLVVGSVYRQMTKPVRKIVL